MYTLLSQRVCLVGLLLCGMSTQLLAQGQGPDPAVVTVERDAHHIEASGLEPGASLLIVGTAQVLAHSVHHTFLVEEVVADDDADGVVLWEPSFEIPEVSAWVAFDLGTGRSWRLDEEHPGRAPAFPPGQFRAGSAGERGGMALGVSRSRVLVVRSAGPEATPTPPGAWRIVSGDGHELDRDGEPDGIVTLDVGDFEIVHGESGLEDLRRDDWIVLVDIDRVTIAMHRLTPADLEPGSGGNN